MRALGGLAILLLATSCSFNDGVSPEASRLGRFQLAKINGGDLPGFVTKGSAARIDFISGAVHLNDDGSFVDSTYLKVTPNFCCNDPSFSTDVAQGSYTVRNDTVFFSSTRKEHYVMVYLSGQSLLQELSGSLLLYTR
jgi:hypothetical protein